MALCRCDWDSIDSLISIVILFASYYIFHFPQSSTDGIKNLARSCCVLASFDFFEPRSRTTRFKQSKTRSVTHRAKAGEKKKSCFATQKFKQNKKSVASLHRLQCLLFVTLYIFKGHISHFTIISHSALLQSTTVANIHSPLIVCFDETILAKIYYLFYLLFDEHDVRNKIEEQWQVLS